MCSSLQLTLLSTVGDALNKVHGPTCLVGRQHQHLKTDKSVTVLFRAVVSQVHSTHSWKTFRGAAHRSTTLVLGTAMVRWNCGENSSAREGKPLWATGCSVVQCDLNLGFTHSACTTTCQAGYPSESRTVDCLQRLSLRFVFPVFLVQFLLFDSASAACVPADVVEISAVFLFCCHTVVHGNKNYVFRTRASKCNATKTNHTRIRS